jgi:hypothetical protein
VQGLLETVIGVDLSAIPSKYKDELFNQPIFTDMEGLTMIPSIAMALLTSHLVIFWLLNVLFLICVFCYKRAGCCNYLKIFEIAWVGFLQIKNPDIIEIYFSQFRDFFSDQDYF